MDALKGKEGKVHECRETKKKRHVESNQFPALQTIKIYKQAKRKACHDD